MTRLSSPEFTTTDYVVFFVLSISSCTGGLWYGAKGSQKKAIKNVSDYLLGGKSMSTFPVSLSLIASYVSGVTLLGTPAEIYNYGTQYYLTIFAVCISAIIVASVYLPVFFTLQLSSSYEYLELRFNKHVRAIASILFLLDEVMFLPMVVYVPALAFNQLTGFNVFLVSGVMVGICGMYTVLGGLRAVVWTDAVQTIIMLVSIVVIAIMGTVYIGSFSTVSDVAGRNNRFDLDNWEFSFYERQSGWAVIIGGAMYWTAFNSVNQTMVQRYISLPTKFKAISALWIFAFGAVLSITVCVWCGLLAFTSWYQAGCDKEGAPLVNDRLLPAFVMHMEHKLGVPGLGGVFLAGVFGAGLSSLSAVLNACALVLVEDLMHGWLNIFLKPLVEGILARILTAILAVTSILMLLVISQLGGILGVATALSAIAASTSCGIFTLGMACPWVGPKGALIGGLAGAIMAGTVSMGTQAAAAKGYRMPANPLEQACAANASFVPSWGIDPDTVFPLFRVSYHWIAPMGFLTTVIVGAALGYFVDKWDYRKVDREIFTPVIWRFLPQEFYNRRGTVRQSHSKGPPSVIFEGPPTPAALRRQSRKQKRASEEAAGSDKDDAEKSTPLLNKSKSPNIDKQEDNR